MKTFKELCEARFSCRHYQDRDVEPARLDYIRQCTQLAPSAVNRQPWRFMVVTRQTPELLERVKQSYHTRWIDEAPVVVVCLVNREAAWTRRYDNHNHSDIDIAIAVEHLCLAAAEQGLGSCWVCNFDVNQLASTVALPEGFTPAALIPLGYPADERPEKKRKAIDEIFC